MNDSKNITNTLNKNNMTTFYCTNTIFNDGSKTEDKGLYIEGLEHATKCVKETIANNPDIAAIVLLSDTKTKNIIIKRSDLN